MGNVKSSTYVALLRGVNVGGNNMISMSALKASFEQLGFEEVASYINSGNVLFKSKQADPRKLEQRIERMLSTEYQLDAKVVVRSVSEMASLVESLPETWNGDARWRYNVIFLRHSIDSEDIIGALQPKKGIEQVTYRPGTLLWSAQVKHLTRTAMLKLSRQKIFKDMTVRNLNTTKKLYELMRKMAQA
jgi:uncharacterized protein (DUF1697 family)